MLIFYHSTLSVLSESTLANTTITSLLTMFYLAAEFDSHSLLLWPLSSCGLQYPTLSWFSYLAGSSLSLLVLSSTYEGWCPSKALGTLLLFLPTLLGWAHSFLWLSIPSRCQYLQLWPFVHSRLNNLHESLRGISNSIFSKAKSRFPVTFMQNLILSQWNPSQSMTSPFTPLFKLHTYKFHAPHPTHQQILSIWLLNRIPSLPTSLYSYYSTILQSFPISFLDDCSGLLESDIHMAARASSYKH